MSYQQFGFGTNDKAFGRQSDLFKMDKNEEARISFLWWPGLEKGELNLSAPTPNFCGGPSHYLQGVGRFMNQGPEWTKIAGEPPKTKIGTLIVKWPLKSDGTINQEAIAAESYDVLYWVFDNGKYDELRTIHNEWNFGTCDLKIKCSDAKFQKMAFSPTKGSVLVQLAKNPEHAVWKGLIQRAQEALPGVQEKVGRYMTIEEIRNKLAGGGGAPGGGGGYSPAAFTQSSSEGMDIALSTILED